MLDLEKIQIIDLFPSIQGEGFLMGKRHIFIRVSGCNLKCKFKNSICDTAYSSYKPEKGKFTLDQVTDLVQSDSATHICLTGGEVCLYPDMITWVKQAFPHHHLTIETNGTLFPGNQIAQQVDLVSISPKMLSSIDPQDQLKERRSIWINRSHETIASWILYGKQTQLKYVVADEEDVKEAIKHIELIEKELKIRINRDEVYLMPAGASFDELCKTRPIVGELAMQYGFSLTDRIQFNFFGNKREA